MSMVQVPVYKDSEQLFKVSLADSISLMREMRHKRIKYQSF